MAFYQNNSGIDIIILKALRNNDEAALNYLFTNYYNRLVRKGLKNGYGMEIIEEAIQSVFIDVWKYRQTLGEIESFEAYLKSALIKRLSKATPKSFITGSDENLDNDLTLSVDAYEQVLISQENRDEKRQLLANALEELTPRQKELIVLRYFEEMSYSEITNKTQLQTDSIYKTIHEALKRLRIILGK